jgi:hypothetical protein
MKAAIRLQASVRKKEGQTGDKGTRGQGDKEIVKS